MLICDQNPSTLNTYIFLCNINKMVWTLEIQEIFVSFSDNVNIGLLSKVLFSDYAHQRKLLVQVPNNTLLSTSICFSLWIIYSLQENCFVNRAVKHAVPIFGLGNKTKVIPFQQSQDHLCS